VPTTTVAMKHAWRIGVGHVVQLVPCVAILEAVSHPWSALVWYRYGYRYGLLYFMMDDFDDWQNNIIMKMMMFCFRSSYFPEPPNQNI
jgi:hypothetical protein